MDKTECPKCGNKMGFAMGTCIDCGYNYLDNKYSWIKVRVNQLPNEIRYPLIDRHDKDVISIRRLKNG